MCVFMRLQVENAGMRVSPRFSAEDWRRLDSNKQGDWSRAIEIFEDRIRGRFLAPINAILWYPWSGFCVLALDSLLVETLQQFWEGQAETPSVLNSKGCRRLLSEKYFRDFLKGPLFEPRFTRRQAELFYTTVRCGIL